MARTTGEAESSESYSHVSQVTEKKGREREKRAATHCQLLDLLACVPNRHQRVAAVD